MLPYLLRAWHNVVLLAISLVDGDSRNRGMHSMRTTISISMTMKQWDRWTVAILWTGRLHAASVFWTARTKLSSVQ